MNFSIKRNITQHVATGTDEWISNCPMMLVYSPYASKKQMDMIGWKRDDFPKNRKEQGGWLIGKYILDASGNPIQGEVTEVFEANTTCRYPGYIEWDAIEEIRLQQAFFELKNELSKTDPIAAEQLKVLGWWHTHPNALDVFLSSIDMETVKLKYYKPEKYSVVLNPHRGLFRAFSGGNAVEVPMMMLLYDDKSICQMEPAKDKTSQYHHRWRKTGKKHGKKNNNKGK